MSMRLESLEQTQMQMEDQARSAANFIVYENSSY